MKIRTGRGKKVACIVQDFPGGVPKAMVRERIGRDCAVNVYPLAAASLEFMTGDLIIASLADAELLPGVAKKLKWPSLARRRLGPGAYAVMTQPTEQANRLAVVGGDLAGLLYGIIHVARLLEPKARWLAYDAGDFVETPAIKHRIYWTWDHSTNWMLDSDGLIDWGAHNAYLKPPEMFVEDSKRLIDHALESRASGILIWGFLRSCHGGVEAGQEVCRYAKERGILLMPSVGTSAYGGFFYEGDHPFSVDCWLKLHPEYRAVRESGELVNRLCPSHPENIRWLREGTQWLFSTFGVAGANLEYGDFCVCHCGRCKRLRKKMGGADPDYYKDMVVSQNPFIETALEINPEALVMYATYTGFSGAAKQGGDYTRASGRRKPEFVARTPADAVCMWTITGMINQQQVPLRTWLDHGTAKELRSSPNWPRGLRPATKRSAAFLHEASQWYGRPDPNTGTRKHTRYSVEVSSIKEGCYRVATAGLDGLSIHGEVPTRCIPYELNYAAFSHFCYHPTDSFRDMAQAQLSHLLGGAKNAEAFAEILANAESGCLTEGDRKTLTDLHDQYNEASRTGTCFDLWRRWKWLKLAADDYAGAQVYLPFP